MNKPQFVISGRIRKQEKKRLALLKHHVKMFLFYEDIDRVYGCGHTDEECDQLLNKREIEIKQLEEKLAMRL